MVLRQILDAVLADVKRHCQARGYREGPGVNNFAPHDAVAAFGMAKLLSAVGFDRYLAIAPEGQIYGYFFERLGVEVLSVYTDYPPTYCEAEGDLGVVAGRRVLLIEDDVIGGRTLRLVIEHLRRWGPGPLGLYLGHTRGVQQLRNIPAEVEKVYVAEDCLSWDERPALEREFTEFFGRSLARSVAAMDYPPLVDAVARFRAFLDHEGHRDPIRWVFPEDALLVAGRWIIRPRPEADAIAEVAAAYERAVADRLGVKFGVLCCCDGALWSYLYAPADRIAAEYHLMPDGLKLSVRTTLDESRIVANEREWENLQAQDQIE